MKCNLMLRVATTAVLSTVLAANAGAATLFLADFEGSTPNVTNPVMPDDGGAGVGSEANANAGTTVGTWEGGDSSDVFGAVFGNAGGTNNALLVDSVLAGNAGNVFLDFGSGVDVLTNDVLIEFDMLASRQGATNRRVRLGINSGTTSMYQLVFEMAPTKMWGFRGDDGANQYIATADQGASTGGAFGNTVDGGGNAPDDLVRVKLEIAAGAVDDTRAKLFVDWDGDGNFTTSTGTVEDVNGGAVEFRNDTITSLDRIQWIYNGSGARGMWLDNISVTSTQIPEPSTLMVASIAAMVLIVANRTR